MSLDDRNAGAVLVKRNRSFWLFLLATLGLIASLSGKHSVLPSAFAAEKQRPSEPESTSHQSRIENSPMFNSGACTPGLALAEQDPIVVERANSGATARPILVGCVEALEAIDDDAIEIIRTLVRANLEPDPQGRLFLNESRQKRQTLAERINEQLGIPQLIQDIYLADAASWESRSHKN